MIVAFWHFFKAWVLVEWAKRRNYQIIADSAAQDRRYCSCVTCEAFNDGQCTICKCLIESKIMLNTERCPKGRWGRRWIRRN